MTARKRLDYLAGKVQVGAIVCLGLIFAWVFFAQPGPLGTAQASEPANPYEAENTKLQAEVNLLKRENERLRKELDEAKKVKAAAAPTDAQGPPQGPAVVKTQTTPDLQNAVNQRDAKGQLTPVPTFPTIGPLQIGPRRKQDPLLMPQPASAPVPVSAADTANSPKQLLSDMMFDNDVLRAQRSVELDTLRRKEYEAHSALTDALATEQDPVARKKLKAQYDSTVATLVSPDSAVTRAWQSDLSRITPQREAQFKAGEQEQTIKQVRQDAKVDLQSAIEAGDESGHAVIVHKLTSLGIIGNAEGDKMLADFKPKSVLAQAEKKIYSGHPEQIRQVVKDLEAQDTKGWSSENLKDYQKTMELAQRELAKQGNDAANVTAKVIRANSFILKDENDKVRAVLSMETGGRRLSLFNAAGKELAFLEVTDKAGPVLTFVDAGGKTIWQAPQSAPVADSPGTR